MDNVTHALVGVLLGRSASRWVGSLRGALWAAILASNVPDIDLLGNLGFEDRRLGYLVHHRGYTHTVLGAALLGLGCAAIAARIDRKARGGALIGLSLVAAMLHIAADALNNYGVHPFWPVANTWFYGDSVFIVEPLVWAVLLPLAWTSTEGRAARGGIGALAALMVVGSGVVLGPVGAAILAGIAGGAFLVQRRWDGIGFPAAACAAVVATFAVGRAEAEAEMRGAGLSGEVLDVVLTPRPATPWCWQGIALTQEGDTYAASTALVSLLPAITSPSACTLRFGEARTAPVTPIVGADTSTVAWRDRFSGRVSELVALDATECRVDAALHFLRAPFWIDDGTRVVVGDLRYDFERGLGFAETEVVRGEPPRGCEHLPPWRSRPVRELLGLEAAQAER